MTDKQKAMIEALVFDRSGMLSHADDEFASRLRTYSQHKRLTCSQIRKLERLVGVIGYD